MNTPDPKVVGRCLAVLHARTRQNVHSDADTVVAILTAAMDPALGPARLAPVEATVREVAQRVRDAAPGAVDAVFWADYIERAFLGDDA